jgi:hypothetical protein
LIGILLVEIQGDTNLLILCKASAPYQIHLDCAGLSNLFIGCFKQFIARISLTNGHVFKWHYQKEFLDLNKV